MGRYSLPQLAGLAGGAAAALLLGLVIAGCAGSGFGSSSAS
ncbi:hypothetical protein QP414_06775 [Corynebacterium simulans]|nr:hypothetical protein [Corynebacterium simulans]